MPTTHCVQAKVYPRRSSLTGTEWYSKVTTNVISPRPIHIRDMHMQWSMRKSMKTSPNRGCLSMGDIIFLKHWGLGWCFLWLFDAKITMPKRTCHGWCMPALVDDACHWASYLAWSSLSSFHAASHWPKKIKPSRHTHATTDVPCPLLMWPIIGQHNFLKAHKSLLMVPIVGWR